MNINMNLIESNSEINNKILEAIKNHLNKTFGQSIKEIESKIKLTVKNAIQSEPEYQSLISGKLHYELGIPDPIIRVNAIIDTWTNSITIRSNPITINGNSLRGGLSITMIPGDYSDVIGLSQATVTDSKSGVELPWLEWLLLYGNRIIIQNHEVLVGSNKNSRTGLAIMISSKENWRVPPEFAGTINDNWVTRALSRINNTIPRIIQKEIEKNI